METKTRVVVAAYIAGLTVALLLGEWPLQGPRLFGVVEDHGIQLGDLVVLATSLLTSAAVMRTGRR